MPSRRNHPHVSGFFTVRALGTALVALTVTCAAVADDATPEVALRPIAPAASATEDTSRPIAAPGGSMTGDATRTAVALVGVIALAFVMKRVLKRVGDPLAARRPSGVVSVLARFPLARGQQVVLLEVGTRVLCVHQGTGGAATLCAFDNLTEIADLKARIEAGSATRGSFDREITRSLERGTALPARASVPSTPTIDLTKRAGRAAYAAGGRA
ncbi:MAG: flagellar biosynthetic protein FliO [Phycisphaerae bacterium]|nr:flagellar biosynthetic protein FliO [Phycisphaerae bacterium]